MALNDPVASALSKINNAERVGKAQVSYSPVSTQIKRIFEILKDNQYIGGYEQKDMQLTINLLHTINKIGAIKPRFAFKKTDYQKVEKQYLPAKDFGIIIVTTPQGIMTLDEAKQKGIGGKLIAYCY